VQRDHFLDAVGMLGSVLVCAGAWGTAYLPPGWSYELGWFALPVRPLTGPAVGCYLVLALGMALWVAAWVGVPAWWRRPDDERHVRRLLWRAALWAAPLLLAPPLASRDAWSYAAVGNMVKAGISPYTQGPAALPGAFSDAVDPLWAHTPTPYGPLFLQLSSLVVTAVGHSVLLNAIVLRVLAVAGLVLVAIFLPRLARHCGGSAAGAVRLVLLNPLVLLHLVGGQHNEALMIGLAVAGLVYALDGRFWHGAVLASLATSIKVPAVVVVGAIGLIWAARMPGRLRRARGLFLAGLLCLATLAVFGHATGLGWGWLRALQTPGEVRGWLSLPTAAGMTIGQVLDLAGAGHHTDELIRSLRVVGAAVAAGIGTVLLLAAQPRRMVYAVGITLLCFAVLAPADQPWYPLWGGVLLAAAALTVRWTRGLEMASLALCGYSLADMARVPLGEAGQVGMVLLLVAAGVTAWISAPGRPRWAQVPAPARVATVPEVPPVTL
jgi:hypothetical protein